MNQENDLFHIIARRLVTSPVEPPASPEEAIANAIAKYHEYSIDGTLLFVFATPSFSGLTVHFYPIIAKDAETAFFTARTFHESRGLPPSYDLHLVFVYGETDEHDSVVS